MALDKLIDKLDLLDRLRIKEIAVQVARLRRYKQLLILRQLLIGLMTLHMRLVVLAFKDARILHPREHIIVFELDGAVGFLVHIVHKQFFRVGYFIGRGQEFGHLHLVVMRGINCTIVKINRLAALELLEERPRAAGRDMDTIIPEKIGRLKRARQALRPVRRHINDEILRRITRVPHNLEGVANHSFVGVRHGRFHPLAVYRGSGGHEAGFGRRARISAALA